MKRIDGQDFYSRVLESKGKGMEVYINRKFYESGKYSPAAAKALKLAKEHCRFNLYNNIKPGLLCLWMDDDTEGRIITYLVE